MKYSIHLVILGACLSLTACNRQEEANRDIVRKLDAISSELGKRSPPLRWATANKSEISTAVFVWSRDKMERAKKAEALPPETEAKVTEYEALRMQLLERRIPPPRPLRSPYDSAPGERSAAEKDYEAVSKRLAEAKAPVAAIVERREREAAEYRNQYSIERLVTEYAKGRYDLVIDAREKVLYQTTGEIPDITEGVLALFREKTKE